MEARFRKYLSLALLMQGQSRGRSVDQMPASAAHCHVVESACNVSAANGAGFAACVLLSPLVGCCSQFHFCWTSWKGSRERRLGSLQSQRKKHMNEVPHSLRFVPFERRAYLICTYFSVRE